jgi:hypothetical protein
VRAPAAPPVPPSRATVAAWAALLAAATSSAPPPPREEGAPPAGVPPDPEGTSGRYAALVEALRDLDAADGARRESAVRRATTAAADADPAERLALARALGHLRAPAGRPVLRRLASDADARTATAARLALLGAPDGTPYRVPRRSR